MAEIKFLGYLADVVAGIRRKKLILREAAPLRKILPPSFPGRDVVILIDQKAGKLDSVIENQSLVVIMPILSGG